jgi:hypothetical protein
VNFFELKDQGVFFLFKMFRSRGVQNDAFAHIDAIKKESETLVVKNENIVSEHYNPDSVKEALKSVIELIDNEIKKMFLKNNI